jgi:cell cycle checkpoint control protein RAD9A
MDCTLSVHAIRTFSSSISALSKIGKDLYVEFDPVDGLILRTLNDAKSAFCEFTYAASYFERCSAAPNSNTTTTKRRSVSQEDRYTCRIPLKAMGAVVRSRKGVVSLRVRNEVSADHLYLSFEFDVHLNGNQLKVVHRIAVADSESVAAVAPKDGCSQIVASPRVLSRMLDPLRRFHEVALIINEPHKVLFLYCVFNSRVMGVIYSYSFHDYVLHFLSQHQLGYK